jgi:hypothetical protein
VLRIYIFERPVGSVRQHSESRSQVRRNTFPMILQDIARRAMQNGTIQLYSHVNTAWLVITTDFVSLVCTLFLSRLAVECPTSIVTSRASFTNLPLPSRSIVLTRISASLGSGNAAFTVANTDRDMFLQRGRPGTTQAWSVLLSTIPGEFSTDEAGLVSNKWKSCTPQLFSATGGI